MRGYSAASDGLSVRVFRATGSSELGEPRHRLVSEPKAAGSSGLGARDTELKVSSPVARPVLVSLRSFAALTVVCTVFVICRGVAPLR